MFFIVVAFISVSVLARVRPSVCLQTLSRGLSDAEIDWTDERSCRQAVLDALRAVCNLAYSELCGLTSEDAEES